jgi:hypothetical protein
MIKDDKREPSPINHYKLCPKCGGLIHELFPHICNIQHPVNYVEDALRQITTVNTPIKPEKAPPSIRLPLWVALDALHDAEGDDYVLFRDEIIKAIETEIDAMLEVASK